MTPDLADERAAWAADYTLLHNGDHQPLPPDPIRCPVHGDYQPHSIIDTECRRCLDQQARNDTRHWRY